MRRSPVVAALLDMINFGFETFGRYYSSYRGFVYSNQDPLSLQRIQIIVPEIGGNLPYKYWAHAKGVFSGTNFGTQMIPQRGEMVWVEFERGHPEVPIYSNGHFGNGEMPTDDADLKDPNCYWFISPGGQRIKINDTKKYFSIQSNGAEVVINSDGKISLKNPSTDMKTILNDILTTYKNTKTIDQRPLSPDSIAAAELNILEVNKLFF